MNGNDQIRVGVYEKALPFRMAWRDKIFVMQEAGYDYLELSIDETDERLSRLNAWHDLVGLPLGSICLSAHRRFPLGSHHPEIRTESLRIGIKAIELASRLGIRIIQLAGYDVFYEEHDEETESHFVANLEILAKHAAKEGILLGFETMETPFMDTMAKAMKYVSLINSPYLHVYPDLGNLTNASMKYGISVEDDLDCARAHILATHVKEVTFGKYRDLFYGEGCVDFKKLLEKCYSLGVRRFVAELWCNECRDWKSDIHNANRTIRSYAV